MKVNIKGMNKAHLLCMLYNNKTFLGMGAFQYRPGPLTMAEAASLLTHSASFDYLYGRPLKIDLSGDELDLTLYNRDDNTRTIPGEEVVEQVRNAEKRTS